MLFLFPIYYPPDGHSLTEEVRHCAVGRNLNGLLGACHSNIQQTPLSRHGRLALSWISSVDCRLERDIILITDAFLKRLR